MIMREKIRGFIVHPSKTFERVKGEGVEEAIRYYFSLLIVYTVVTSIIYSLTEYKNQPMLLFFSMLGSLAAGLLMLILGAAWLHIWLLLLGGKGYVKTVKVVAYARTPYFLFGWLAILPLVLMPDSLIFHIVSLLIDGIFLAWFFALTVIGVREIHELTTSKALLAVIISLIPLILLLTFFILLEIWVVTFPITRFIP